MVTEWNWIIKDKRSHPSTLTLCPGQAEHPHRFDRLFSPLAAFSIHFKGSRGWGMAGILSWSLAPDTCWAVDMRKHWLSKAFFSFHSKPIFIHERRTRWQLSKGMWSVKTTYVARKMYLCHERLSFLREGSLFEDFFLSTKSDAFPFSQDGIPI